MQSLLLPAPWFSKTHFGPHRFDIDPGRVSLHVWPPPTEPKASLRASSSAFPMSGNLPTSTQSEGADTTQRQPAPETVGTSSIDVTQPEAPPRRPTLVPVEGPGVPQATSFLPPEDFQVNPTAQVPSYGSTVLLSQSISASPQLHALPAPSATRVLPPRSTRRAKAHVASACVNCKKKHLGCDSARPCRRCVLSGKAATCVDVTHKKRGRPPLKAEESSLRAVPLEGSISSREQYHTAASRGPGHTKTSSREIRPITDLQYPRPLEHDTAGSQSHISPIAASSGRWQQFTSPQILPASQSQRPMTSSGPPTLSNINYPPNPYIPYHGSVYSPTSGSSDMQALLAYGERPPVVTSPIVSPQQYQPNYSPALQSHISPQTPTRASDISGPSLGLRDPYSESGVRLPPILPSPPFAPRTSTHSHRRSDPYPNIAAYKPLSSPQHEVPSQVARPQESPRAMLEFPAPFPSVSRPQNVVSAGPIERNPHTQVQQSQGTIASAATQATPERRRRSEADSEENPKPAKRRRMAVDDIVND